MSSSSSASATASATLSGTTSSSASSSTGTSSSTGASSSSSSAPGSGATSSRAFGSANANPIALTAHNLSFTVDTVVPKTEGGKVTPFSSKKEKKVILDNVSFGVEPGRMLCIMGASGAGKTSLLNAMANRVPLSQVGGELKANGEARPVDLDTMGVVSFVSQDDVLMEQLTVREVLEFSARLRLPSSMSTAEKLARVDQVMAELGLTEAANTPVGNSTLSKGISGGERKRTAIAVELLTDPSVLFLDEPTSGLDSHTAHSVVSLLRDLARGGRTVILTIHQPSSDIYALFDQLLILKLGRIAFYGDASDCVDFFAEHGLQCPKFSNPADYFLRTLALVDTDHMLADAHEQAASNAVDIDKRYPGGIEQFRSRFGYGASFFVQLYLLTVRAWRVYLRNPMLTKARLGQTLIFSLLVGAIYFNVGNDQRGVTDAVGALFFIVINQAMSSVFGVISSFPPERALFISERGNRMYSTGAYFMGKTVAELPFQFLFPIIFSLVCYWLVGFNDDGGRFFIFAGALIAVVNVGQSLGLTISAGVSDINVALALAPVCIIPFLLFSGGFGSVDSIPDWLEWIKYLSIFKWGLDLLIINQFDGIDSIDCSAAQTAAGKCAFQSGDDVLDTYSLGDESIPEIFAVFIGLYVLFRSLAFFFLWKSVQKKK